MIPMSKLVEGVVLLYISKLSRRREGDDDTRSGKWDDLQSYPSTVRLQDPG
jgi:hypothetical protein